MKYFVRIFIFSIFVLSATTFAVSQEKPSVDFLGVVLKTVGGDSALAKICPIYKDVVAMRVFKDYGAMFVASSSVRYPDSCVFTDEDSVSSFQSQLTTKSANIGGKNIELQQAAMDALLEAAAEVKKNGLSITPRGSSAAGRSYADTARIWNSRFEPALKYWTGKKKISAADSEATRKMATNAQVAQVIEWEKNGWWFSTGFDRSIFSSVAAPGTSQHLSLIALDVSEFANKDVRDILNKHGWFQTIIDDTPHFTYIGVDESELPQRGLILRLKNGYKFWIPNLK
ncbi:MAG: hypothetical protein ACRD6X_12920 [Pyrinomonadaceae bacterium]